MHPTIRAVWLPLAFSILCVIASVQLATVFAIPALFGLFDARARWKEYRRYVLTLPYGISVHVALRRMQSSRCQREAMAAAYPEATAYYYNKGYRWWHLLPDGTLSIRNNCYLKLSFYTNLLGIKR